MDSSMFADVTKSVDELRAQISMSNVKVPRIDAYKDVFDFISEYEMATATLPDEQRLKLLVKAFPPGRLKSWYDKEVEPLVTHHSSWSTIKNKIIQRYSYTGDQDRHFKKVITKKFDPSGSSTLFDHVEDILFSFVKAFPSEKSDTTQIQFIKSSLPSAITPTLTTINRFNNPKDLKDFLEGIRQYDIIKAGCPSPNEGSGDKLKSSEILDALKDIVKGLKQEGEATRQAVAALRANPRSFSPVKQQLYDGYVQPTNHRPMSPIRQNYHMNGERSISPFNDNSRRRTPSPTRQFVDRNHNYNNRNFPTSYHYQQAPQPKQHQHYQENESAKYASSMMRPRYTSPSRPGLQNDQNRMHQSQHQVFNQDVRMDGSHKIEPKQGLMDHEYYYKKFGMPPTPCPSCGYLHWQRHCPNHLN